ncbi:hypothetical protein PSPO01_00854 [Paraphaeosphaeria sporulosa]
MDLRRSNIRQVYEQCAQSRIRMYHYVHTPRIIIETLSVGITYVLTLVLATSAFSTPAWRDQAHLQKWASSEYVHCLQWPVTSRVLPRLDTSDTFLRMFSALWNTRARILGYR